MVPTATVTSVVQTKGIFFMCSTHIMIYHDTAVHKEDGNKSSTGLMVGVIITSLLVVLLASILLGIALVLWKQRKGTYTNKYILY